MSHHVDSGLLTDVVFPTITSVISVQPMSWTRLEHLWKNWIKLGFAPHRLWAFNRLGGWSILKLGISSHARRGLEAPNRRGASYFNLATLFLFLNFLPPSFPHFHFCVRCYFTVLSRSHCHFLSRAFSLALCLAFLLMFSLVCGVLPRVLFSSFALIVFCGFIHSIFTFFGFGRFCLGRFSFTGFALTVYKRYAFLSLYAWKAFWMFVS